jgi:hypothetical protein
MLSGNLLALAKCCRPQSAWAFAHWRPDLSGAPERQVGRKAQPDMARVEVGVSAELVEPRPLPQR